MKIFRKAIAADLEAIYNLQNVSFRSEVFDYPLPELPKFALETMQAIENGMQHYFVLEENGKIEGFGWFQVESDLWFVTIWGRWLRTLVYCTAKAAFEKLCLPKIFFCVRRENKRMIQLCKEYDFRQINESTGIATAHDYSRISIVKVLYYELTRSDFEQKSAVLKQHSLQVEC